MSDLTQTAAIPAAEACETTTFGVTGMACAACVRRIEKSLAKVDGVSSASVNLATEQATVEYDCARVSFEAMKRAVEAAGYGIREERAPAQQVELAISGMHCASCVRRVEKALTKLPGVESASVNLATERATVSFSGALTQDDFQKAVEAAGYGVREDMAPSAVAVEAIDEDAARRARELRDLKLKFIASATVSLVLMALMFWP